MTHGDENRPVVVKVGGSLFDLRDLPRRLERLTQRLFPAPVCLIAGGGAAANVVREWDRRFMLSPSASHWLAIEAMQMAARLLQELLPAAVLVESWDDIAPPLRSGRVVILSLTGLLRSSEREGIATPPHSWDVTSDSLAAWTAQRLGARLLLAKSVAPPSTTIADAISAGLVDGWFHNAQAGSLRVDWVDLRADQMRITPWIASSSTPGAGPFTTGTH